MTCINHLQSLFEFLRNYDRHLKMLILVQLNVMDIYLHILYNGKKKFREFRCMIYIPHRLMFSCIFEPFTGFF
jgi:hypothetical protein